jgi:hypothetical protein
MTVPVVPWAEVAGRIQHRIIRPPEVSPHIVPLGKTGSGKDHMVRYGILPAFPLARVVWLVTKRGGDRTLTGWGNHLDGPGDLKPGFGRAHDGDGTARYVVPLEPGKVSGREVKRLLHQLAAEGGMILVIGDAARLSTPPEYGGLGLERDLSNMMIEGREVALTVIASSGSAAWAASAIKDQAAAVLIGQGGGEMRDKFATIAGLESRSPERRSLDTIAPGTWLYTDHADGELHARLARAPAAGTVSEAWPEADA